MRTRVMAAAALGAAVMVWVGVSAQQETQPRPGFGSGVVDVRGTVSIEGLSEVRVANVADVRVMGLPDVRVASVPAGALTGPTFLEGGISYRITWSAGDTETVRVTGERLGGGWVRVESKPGPRWVNLNAARAIERLQ